MPYYDTLYTLSGVFIEIIIIIIIIIINMFSVEIPRTRTVQRKRKRTAARAYSCHVIAGFGCITGFVGCMSIATHVHAQLMVRSK